VFETEKHTLSYMPFIRQYWFIINKTSLTEFMLHEAIALSSNLISDTDDFTVWQINNDE
jgi:hypothetical protein